MTKKQKKYLEYSEFLAKLGKKNSKPRARRYGICHNFYLKFGVHLPWREYRRMEKKWKHFSGRIFYPIPHKSGCYYAFTCLSLWTGEYGKMRRAFARYLSREFKKLAKKL